MAVTSEPGASASLADFCSICESDSFFFFFLRTHSASEFCPAKNVESFLDFYSQQENKTEPWEDVHSSATCFSCLALAWFCFIFRLNDLKWILLCDHCESLPGLFLTALLFYFPVLCQMCVTPSPVNCKLIYVLVLLKSGFSFIICESLWLVELRLHNIVVQWNKHQTQVWLQQNFIKTSFDIILF